MRLAPSFAGTGTKPGTKVRGAWHPTDLITNGDRPQPTQTGSTAEDLRGAWTFAGPGPSRGLDLRGAWQQVWHKGSRGLAPNWSDYER